MQGTLTSPTPPHPNPHPLHVTHRMLKNTLNSGTIVDGVSQNNPTHVTHLLDCDKHAVNPAFTMASHGILAAESLEPSVNPYVSLALTEAPLRYLGTDRPSFSPTATCLEAIRGVTAIPKHEELHNLPHDVLEFRPSEFGGDDSWKSRSNIYIIYNICIYIYCRYNNDNDTGSANPITNIYSYTVY